ncbi:hypothetical protein B0H13DRAFT_1879434 [Mycena leptocephala]|nr:hypothetical protein B0H13DRAFT_1879434 [Mycena leptocephala]
MFHKKHNKMHPNDHLMAHYADISHRNYELETSAPCLWEVQNQRDVPGGAFVSSLPRTSNPPVSQKIIVVYTNMNQEEESIADFKVIDVWRGALDADGKPNTEEFVWKTIPQGAAT